MFKWDELDGLKKSAMDQADTLGAELDFRTLKANEVIIYQNEQIIRELRSIGWKLKEINDRGAL